MSKVIVVDANVIIRFLLHDDPKLYATAERIFRNAQNEGVKIYLDEIILAEVVWVLASFYKIGRVDIVNIIEDFISQKWVKNRKKILLTKALALYSSSNLDYIDCWLSVVSKVQRMELVTFDKDLKKYNLS